MKVNLVQWFGNDEMIVDTARVSFNKKSTNYDELQNQKLINYLAKHGHWSPFSHPQLQFRIECPIYVERQLFKTQVGVSINSRSGRYVDFSDTYTKINIWRTQHKNYKQGSGEQLSKEIEVQAKLIETKIINFAQTAYQTLVKLGVSKEQCRTILPLCLNTEFIWTGSFYALIRLSKQRLKEDAQFETREVVKEMLQQIKTIPEQPFKYSLKAFGYV
jgi:thymidylate synthase (FAD)